MAIVLASGAIASGCSTAVDRAPVVKTEFIRPAVPAIARRACDDPVLLPDRDLTEAETTSLWGRDRSALRQCEPRRAAAVAAVDGAAP
jgi:hypothetical protein